MNGYIGMDAYVARQPIFNQRKKIIGYELLFRNEIAQFMPDIDGDVATSTVLGNTFFNIGTDNLVGDKKSFINFTQNLLLQKVPLLLPREGTVVEILENVEPTAELIEACREISAKGYTIALDDFTYSPKFDSLIEIADIIKFDFRLTSLEDIRAYLDIIPKKNHRQMLAEKVETYEELEVARQMGFELFQGYFFCKPELVKGKEIAGSQISLLRILAEVNRADFDFGELDKIIAPDVGLSYKLLRYINSAFFAKANPINSIQQALVYMGEDEIRRFVSLITMSTLAVTKPTELVRTACIRGKFCESLAATAETGAASGEFFTLGIFSLIDAIVDQPMEKVMATLPLSQNIQDALVRRKGPLVGYLALAECYEKGQWPLVVRLAHALKIEQSLLPSIYSQSIEWANTLSESE